MWRRRRLREKAGVGSKRHGVGAELKGVVPENEAHVGPAGAEFPRTSRGHEGAMWTGPGRVPRSLALFQAVPKRIVLGLQPIESGRPASEILSTSMKVAIHLE